MTFQEYLVAVSKSHAAHPSMRLGQAYVDLLPLQLFTLVLTQPFDPYNNDDNLPEFLEWVERNWPA